LNIDIFKNISSFRFEIPDDHGLRPSRYQTRKHTRIGNGSRKVNTFIAKPGNHQKIDCSIRVTKIAGHVRSEMTLYLDSGYSVLVEIFWGYVLATCI
jgi:hypothetical protein